MALFNDAVPRGRTKKVRKCKSITKRGKCWGSRPPPLLQYGTANRARATLKRIRQFPLTKQKQMARSMYYRAKYHAQQTNGMRAAMKVYVKFIDK